MVILDLARRLMYNFYYNTLKAKYGDRVNLLFTDTDSLCISVNTNDVYEDMKELQNELDCSDYPTDHPLHSDVDLMDMSNLAEYNDGVHFVAIFIDIFSSYLYVEPMKNKSTKETLTAIKNVFL